MYGYNAEQPIAIPIYTVLPYCVIWSVGYTAYLTMTNVVHHPFYCTMCIFHPDLVSLYLHHSSIPLCNSQLNMIVLSTSIQHLIVQLLLSVKRFISTTHTKQTCKILFEIHTLINSTVLQLQYPHSWQLGAKYWEKERYGLYIKHYNLEVLQTTECVL